MTANVTPYWPTPSLLTSLSNAGWGELAGNGLHAVRSVLDALARSLDYQTGSGFATAPQIADRAGGISERWTRRCLEFLERIGLITWTRGGVIDGKPAPSHFRIIKSALVKLIRLARPAQSAKEARRRRSTLERIRAAQLWFTKSKKQKTKLAQFHAELSSSPTHSKEWTSPRAASPRSANPIPQPQGVTMAIACAHAKDVRTCHKCVSLNMPPPGFEFDFSFCRTCNHAARGHELMVRVELRQDGFAHQFEPELVRHGNA